MRNLCERLPEDGPGRAALAEGVNRTRSRFRNRGVRSSTVLIYRRPVMLASPHQQALTPTVPHACHAAKEAWPASLFARCCGRADVLDLRTRLALVGVPQTGSPDHVQCRRRRPCMPWSEIQCRGGLFCANPEQSVLGRVSTRLRLNDRSASHVKMRAAAPAGSFLGKIEGARPLQRRINLSRWGTIRSQHRSSLCEPHRGSAVCRFGAVLGLVFLLVLGYSDQ